MPISPAYHPADDPTRRRWRIAHSEASSGWGGQEHRVFNELAGFRERGSRVALISEPTSGLAKRCIGVGIEVVPTRFKRVHLPVELTRLVAWLKRHRIEVLNPHSSKDGWLLGLAGRLAKTPLIIRSKHIDVDYPRPWSSKHAYSTVADHVITTSGKIKAKMLASMELEEDRIDVIATGVDVGHYTREGPKADLGLPDNGRPVVGMVSVLRSWKGHRLLFQAAHILRTRGIPLRIAIVGGAAPVERFRQFATEEAAEDLVTFTGHREDVADVLRALDLLVIPSTKHEGIPQIGLQGLATEVPIVGSDCGGIPEIVRDGKTGRIFPTLDAEALANRIEEALNETERSRELAAAGRQLVESDYSINCMFDRLEALYERYLPRHPTR
jgi:glycosyltransferase involved in cell wall biosynthesis